MVEVEGISKKWNGLCKGPVAERNVKKYETLTRSQKACTQQRRASRSKGWRSSSELCPEEPYDSSCKLCLQVCSGKQLKSLSLERDEEGNVISLPVEGSISLTTK